MKRVTKAFSLMAALVLMAGLCLVATGPAAACGEFTLTVATDGNGSTDPSGTNSYEYGDHVWVDAYANDCYQFDYWSGDVAEGHRYDNPILIHMSSNKSITAHFKAVENCSPSPEPSPTPSPEPSPTPSPEPTPTPTKICQYAKSASATSENNLGSLAIYATGAPNAPEVGNCSVWSGYGYSWTPANWDVKATLTLTYDTPVYATDLTIYGDYDMCWDRMWLKNSATGEQLLVFPGNDENCISLHTFDGSFLADTVILETCGWSWSATDAVELCGNLAQVEPTPSPSPTPSPEPIQPLYFQAPVVVLSVVVAPASAITEVGDTQQFTATANCSDGTSSNITAFAAWTSADSSVATVNTTGNTTGQAEGVAIGNTTITATYDMISGSANLNVIAGKGVIAVEVKPGNATIPVGDTQQFTATAYYANSTSADVTATASWDSSQPGVANVASGQATGIATGITDIAATYSGVLSNPATLTVTTPKPTVLSVEVKPGNATIPVGGTQQFTATAHYSDSTSADVTATASWDSSELGVATVASGLATGVAPGVSEITATFDSVLSDPAATLTVKPALKSIVVEPGNATFSPDGTQQFTATAYYSDGGSKAVTNEVTWESSDEGIATIDSAGLATGIDPGHAQITASLEGVSSNPAGVTVGHAVAWSLIGGIIGGVLALGLLLFFLLRRRRRGEELEEA